MGQPISVFEHLLSQNEHKFNTRQTKRSLNFQTVIIYWYSLFIDMNPTKVSNEDLQQVIGWNTISFTWDFIKQTSCSYF